MRSKRGRFEITSLLFQNASLMSTKSIRVHAQLRADSPWLICKSFVGRTTVDRFSAATLLLSVRFVKRRRQQKPRRPRQELLVIYIVFYSANGFRSSLRCRFQPGVKPHTITFCYDLTLGMVAIFIKIATENDDHQSPQMGLNRKRR